MLGYFAIFFSSPFEDNAVHSPVLWFIYVNTGMCHMSGVELNAFFSTIVILFFYFYIVLAIGFLSDSLSTTYKNKFTAFYLHFSLLLLGSRYRKSYKYFLFFFYFFFYLFYLGYIGFIPYRLTLDVHLIFLSLSTFLFIFLIGTIKIKNFFYFDLTGDYTFFFFAQVFKNLKLATQGYFFLSFLYVVIHFTLLLYYTFVLEKNPYTLLSSNIVMNMRTLDLIYCFFESYLYSVFVCRYIHLLVELDFKNRSVLIQYPKTSFFFLKKKILDFFSKHYQNFISLFGRK